MAKQPQTFNYLFLFFGVSYHLILYGKILGLGNWDFWGVVNVSSRWFIGFPLKSWGSLCVCVWWWWGGGGAGIQFFPPFDHPRHSAVPPSPGVAIFVAWVHMPEVRSFVGWVCCWLPSVIRAGLLNSIIDFLKTPWCKMNSSRMFFLIVSGKEPKRTVAWSSPCHLSTTLQMADVWKIHLLL